MKLSTNFTLFGLNVKAIQSYLKEQAKDRRGVRVTRRGDLVYIITAYTAFKLPAVLYPDVIQPVTLRECPADGVTTREDTKDFVRERCRTDRAFRQKTLHALQESGIDGWRPLHPARTSNKEDTAHADTTL